MVSSYCMLVFYVILVVTSTVLSNPLTSRITFTCPPSLIKCPNYDRCIQTSQLCDGQNNCGDNTDEQHCVYPETTITAQSSTRAQVSTTTSARPLTLTSPRPCDPANEWKCNDGRCINRNWLCDNDYDCDGGEDERDCPEITCDETSQWMCRSGNRTFCITLRWRCDGEHDCVGGEDERDCIPDTTTTTTSTTPDPSSCNGILDFFCDSGACIHHQWRCDGQNDCGDNSDEKDCDGSEPTTTTAQTTSTRAQMTTTTSTQPSQAARQCDAANQYKCNDDSCIYRAWLCDNENDCDGGEDEMDCPDNNTAITRCDKASRPQWTCRSGHRTTCIPLTWRCDGEIDCLGEEDERDCFPTTANTGCDRNSEFMCDTGRCIILQWRCDGDNDCADASDERDCHPLVS